MKKYISLLIAFVLLFTLAACNGDKEDETTTTLPLSVETTVNPVSVSQTEAENPTYILTTQYGETMPTVVTTKFDLSNEVTVTTAASTTTPEFNFTVPSSMTAPEVISEQLSTSATTKGQNSEGDKETTTEEATKTESEKERKNFDVSSYCINSTGNIEFSFELAGWGGIKAGKISGISISYDDISSTVDGYVKQGSDGGLITVYTKDLSLPSSTVISCTIPAGVVVSKSGNIYNMSYTFSITTGGDPADYE